MAAVFAENSVHRPWRICKKKKKKERERKRKRNKSRITRRLGCRTRNSWSCRIHIRWWNRSNVLVVTVVTNATLNVTIQQGPVLRLCFKSGSEFFTSCCFVCQKKTKSNIIFPKSSALSTQAYIKKKTNESTKQKVKCLKCIGVIGKITFSGVT